MLPDPNNFASLCMHKYIPDVHVHVCPLLKILTMGVLLAWLHNIPLYLGGGVNLLAEVKNKARQSGLGLPCSLSLYGVWELAPPVNIGVKSPFSCLLRQGKYISKVFTCFVCVLMYASLYAFWGVNTEKHTELLRRDSWGCSLSLSLAELLVLETIYISSMTLGLCRAYAECLPV